MRPFACASPSKPFRPHEALAESLKDQRPILTRQRRENRPRKPAITRALTFLAPERGIAAVRAEDLIVVVTSAGTEEQALDIAHALIRKRQAACVNLVPNVHSIYRWKGRVCDDGEFLVIIKTCAKSFASVKETIQKVNTYELPEVLAYRVDDASPGFAEWIQKATAVSARKSVRAKAKVQTERRRAVR